MFLIIIITITIIILFKNSFNKNTSLKIESEVPISIWDFTVNNNREEIQKINLFQSSNENELESQLAPGTSGSFQIFLDATETQVAIKYNIISIEETMEEVLLGTINVNDKEKTRTFQIYWEWKYETGNTKEEIIKNDLIDTEDMNNIRKYNFVICVSGEQIKL